MRIEDIKRWHWMLISLAIGLALSYVWSNAEFGDRLPTMGQADFERGVVTQPEHPGHITDILLLPKTERDVQPVMCAQLRPTKVPGAMEYRPALFRAPVPFISERDGRTYPDLATYLSQSNTENPQLSFRYAWYRQTWAVYALWTAASLILIGIVWPSVVSLMTGGGLGLLPVKSEQPEYDLSRFGRGEPDRRVAGAHHDPQELRRLDEELEQRLMEQSRSETAAAAAPATAVSAQPVRPLDAGPRETNQIGKPQEQKEYGGEFYPVEKPGHKK